MKKLIFLAYHLFSWLIILLLFVSFLLLFILESPASFFKVLEKPLTAQGIKYGKIEGSLLSGFTLHNVNYQEQIKIRSLVLKVDFKRLEDRVLYIDKLVLNGLEIEKEFLANLVDQNSTTRENSETNISLPFDRIVINDLRLSIENTLYDKYHLNHAKLEIKKFKTDMKKKHKGELYFMLDSNVSKLTLEGKIENNRYDINANIEGEKLFLSPLIRDLNLTFSKNPKFHLEAKGDFEKIYLKARTNVLALNYDTYSMETKSLVVDGYYDFKKKAINVNLNTKLEANVARFEMNLHAFVAVNDINNTLVFDVKSSVYPKQILVENNLIKDKLKQQNIEIYNFPNMLLFAKGNMQNIDFNTTLSQLKFRNKTTAVDLKNFELRGEVQPLIGQLKFKVKSDSLVLHNNINSLINLETQEIKVDWIKENVRGALTLNSRAKKIAFELQSKFVGDYMKPKNLQSNTTLNILEFNAFGTNLTELLPMALKIETNNRGLNLEVNAKKIKLELLTEDYNKFDFFVKSDAVYPYNIVELPRSLKDKFVKLDLKGKAYLTEQYLTLKGKLVSNEEFQVKVDVSSLKEGINANISTKEVSLKVNGDLETKELTAKLEIDSLKRVQKEFRVLYPFGLLNVDGRLEINARLKDEVMGMSLISKKIKLQEFSLDDLLVDANYEKELITINKLNFKTVGFKDNSLNQNFYLNQKGFVGLGEEKKLLLDMHPKILLKAKGHDESLKAIVQIEALPLGYPAYGKTILSCDIDYLQEGEKKKIIGGIFLDKLKVFYESNFLDPSYDNDVVVVSKNIKSKKLDDSFLNHTFVDVGIYTEEAKYKTKDMDLEFDVHIKAQKAFGQELKLLGKVNEINGRVEQAPKLFTVVDSSIVFQGRKEINPLLDLKVEHELPDILITINIHGNAKRPKLTFTSEPPLPKKDILSYLLLGVSTAGLGEGKGSLGREAQLFIMNQAARDLAHELELDRVFVKDDGTGEGYAIQVGKKINDKSMFIIENSTEGNSFILEYDVSKNIKVEVGQHQKTVPSQSIDIYFRKRFK